MSDDAIDTLSESELLRSLSRDELVRLFDVGRVEHWQDQAILLEEGSFGPRMMVLLDGQVEVLRRDGAGVERPIARLGPGDVLGEMSLLLELPRTATVRALSDLRVFAMDRQAFLQMVDQSEPAVLKLGLELSRVLAARLTRLNDKVMTLLAENDDMKRRFGEERQEVFHLWDSDF
jgi:CRP-like cAMP-binding protein